MQCHAKSALSPAGEELKDDLAEANRLLIEAYGLLRNHLAAPIAQVLAAQILEDIEAESVPTTLN